MNHDPEASVVSENEFNSLSFEKTNTFVALIHEFVCYFSEFFDEFSIMNVVIGYWIRFICIEYYLNGLRSLNPVRLVDFDLW